MAGSQSMLATMYEKGVGVERDPAEAAKWRARSEETS
jgi:TPR repeat protein